MIHSQRKTVKKNASLKRLISVSSVQDWIISQTWLCCMFGTSELNGLFLNLSLIAVIEIAVNLR